MGVAPSRDYGRAKFEGYCPYCKNDRTFTIDSISIPSGDPWNNIKDRWALDRFGIDCPYDHTISFWVEIKKLEIQKIGQTPSVADIAIEENRQKYRSVLKGENWGEFYKAIGLAAHGEGIGSFVYLRRIFERLIFSRFDELKTVENWDEKAFRSLRMDEKILFLKGHIPNYLVEIRAIYGIFSKGIHELDNAACLNFFEIGKRSILIILTDDLKRLEELEERRQMVAAVARFSGGGQSLT